MRHHAVFSTFFPQGTLQRPNRTTLITTTKKHFFMILPFFDFETQTFPVNYSKRFTSSGTA